MYTSSADGSRIYYEKTGKGSPVILLHGFGGDHTIWNTTGWVDCLREKHEVFVMDLRGCGKSDVPESAEFYSIDNHINDIEAIILQEKLADPVLFGWSLGATIVTHFCAKYPVEKAIFCGSYFGLIFTKELIDNGINNTDDNVLKERFRALRHWPVIQPSQMSCPFLAYTGTNDGNVVKKLTEQRASITANNGILHVFPGLDHFGLLSQIEAVKGVVLSFLNQKKDFA